MENQGETSAPQSVEEANDIHSQIRRAKLNLLPKNQLITTFFSNKNFTSTSFSETFDQTKISEQLTKQKILEETLAKMKEKILKL